MKKNTNRNDTVNDLTALRAFVMPDIYPFILEVYKKDGKDEQALQEDIKRARESYKELRSQSTRSTNSKESQNTVA